MSKNPKPYGIETYHQACERIRFLRAFVKDVRRPKGERQAVFSELRGLESFWGLESYSYNGEM